ncbi:MAG: hypothetical protein JNM93_14495 [Bacteriovoracaceae bacterium]|nr:hypothetical protein [Bacteriovoracaceae bacterium]
MKILNYLIILILVSCASKPVLYPNDVYKEVGKEEAEKDVEICMDEAEKFLESSKGKQMLKGAASGSIFGAVVGAATGLITGDIKNSIGRGALVGGAAGGAAAGLSPDQIKRNYVNQCLGEKGYRVIGWD